VSSATKSVMGAIPSAPPAETKKEPYKYTPDTSTAKGTDDGYMNLEDFQKSVSVIDIKPPADTKQKVSPANANYQTFANIGNETQVFGNDKKATTTSTARTNPLSALYATFANFMKVEEVGGKDKK